MSEPENKKLEPARGISIPTITETGGVMTQDEIKAAVLKELCAIAPELEGEEINPDVNFRDQFDFDSMDFLNFAIALHKKLSIDIPEIDYPKLSNLAGCLKYLDSKLVRNTD